MLEIFIFFFKTKLKYRLNQHAAISNANTSYGIENFNFSWENSGDDVILVQCPYKSFSLRA